MPPFPVSGCIVDGKASTSFPAQAMQTVSEVAQEQDGKLRSSSR